MRLDWQCPTCFAELGDKSHAKMLTCPYCGSLLIVDAEKKKFYRVPRGKGWYYFSKVNVPGYIQFGEHREIYTYRQGKWFLIRQDGIYILISESENCDAEVVEEGKVTYIWGELPFVAPPESVLKTAICKNGLVKIAPREKLIFLKSAKKFPDIPVELLQGAGVQ